MILTIPHYIVIITIYLTQVHFEGVTSILEIAKISTESLFVNFDANFDIEIIRKITTSKSIISNICENKRKK